jgi:hypothetical protein
MHTATRERKEPSGHRVRPKGKKKEYTRKRRFLPAGLNSSKGRTEMLEGTYDSLHFFGERFREFYANPV